MTTRTLLIILAFIGCIVAGVFALYALYIPLPWQERTSAPVFETPMEIYTELIETNDSFQKGMNAYNYGRWDEAVAEFRQALGTTSDPAPQATIKFRLAISLTNVGEYEEAVSLYKSVAANTQNYIPWLRASAIQELGLMYMRHMDQRVTDAVFSDEPYASLYTDGAGEDIAYRNLFAYAATVYPLATSELWAAHWYANALLSPSASLASDSVRRAQYLDVIRTNIALADADIATIADDPSRVIAYLGALLLRANLVEKMARLGDASFGNPEDGFKQLISLYASDYLPAQDGLVRVHYAIYLAETAGDARAADIKVLLAPLTGENPASLPPRRFLSISSQDDGRVKARLSDIASTDADFKAVLVSNGWTNADFK